MLPHRNSSFVYTLYQHQTYISFSFFFLIFLCSLILIFLIPPLPYASSSFVYTSFYHHLFTKCYQNIAQNSFEKLSFTLMLPHRNSSFVYTFYQHQTYISFSFLFFDFFCSSLLIFLIPPLPYASSSFVYTSFYHHLFTNCFQNIAQNSFEKLSFSLMLPHRNSSFVYTIYQHQTYISFSFFL